MPKESRRKRGLEYQRWCKTWIEEQWPGAVVHNQPMNHFRLPNGIWASRSNDIFGCVDLIAIIPGGKPMFIQCSMHTNVESRLQDFAKIPWNLDHCTVQLWQKRPDGSTVVRMCIREKEDLKFIEAFDIIRRKLWMKQEMTERMIKVVAPVIESLPDPPTQ